MPGFIKMIWAQSTNGALGKNNQLIFRCKRDLEHFKSLTEGCIVVMGRKTWNSLPNQQPLPNRYNVVLSRDKDFYVDHDSVEVINDLDEFLKRHKSKKIWIIGGAEVYRAAMDYAGELEITWFHKHVFEDQADAWAPPVDFNLWQEIKRTRVMSDDTGALQFHFCTYKRIRHLRFTKAKP